MDLNRLEEKQQQLQENIKNLEKDITVERELLTNKFGIQMRPEPWKPKSLEFFQNPERTYRSIREYFELREKASDKTFFERNKKVLEDIPDSNGSRYYSKFNINIGIVADEFLFQSYKDTANFIYITPDNYKEVVDQLDLFIAVTTWRGLNNEWVSVGNPNSKRREELHQIIDFYKEKGINTVFYSKEDPVNYDIFIDIAKRCKYIFTTEEAVVDQYKMDCNNENAYCLAFGINPIYHNPIGMKNKHKKNGVLFAGSWYDKYSERKVDTKTIFNGVIYSGKELKIIDRNYTRKKEQYLFPEQYLQYISPEIPHDFLQKVHKLYDWSINLNSVKYSATMFANRVYELQALGNVILSNYSAAINNKFPNVFLANDMDEVNFILNGYSDEEIYEQQIYGIRQVMSNETTFQRLEYLLKSIGLEECGVIRKVAVVVEEVSPAIKENFGRQTYPYKELVLKSEFTEDTYNQFDMVAFFHEDYHYGEFYLEDLINGFKYTDSDYITKDGYLDGKEVISGVEHNYVNVIKDKYRTVFWTKAFGVQALLDLEGPKETANGYSIDHFECNKQAIQEAQFIDRDYKLSVIVPVYNNGKYLQHKCFNSLKRSSIFDQMEIILIDDGSTDHDTKSIVNKLCSQYENVKSYMFNDGGSGSASRPRNKGIELATSKYVTYLDPDNEAINDGYAKLLELITSDKKLDMVVGNIIKINHIKAKQSSFYTYVMQANKSGLIKDGKKVLIETNMASQSIQALVVKKDLIISNNLSMVENAAGQDTLFFQQLLLKSKMTKVIELDIHIYYAAVEGSVTNQISKKFFEKFLILEEQRLPFLKENGLLKAYVERRFVYYFKRWYLDRVSRIIETDLEDALKVLFKIYSMYKPYLTQKDPDLSMFEDLYNEGQFEEIRNTFRSIDN